MPKTSFAWNQPVDLCTPFRYANEAVTAGSRIGGPPPNAAIPRFETPFQKYFGTLEFDENFAITIFYSFEIYGQSEDRDVLKFHYKILRPSEWIHAVVHKISGPAEQPAIPAEVTCHRLEIRESETDLEEVEVDPPLWLPPEEQKKHSTKLIPNPESKFGGAAYIERAAHVEELFQQLDAEGFRLLAQFEGPSREELDYMENFPWDPGWLHVFVRGEHPPQLEFAFVIQY